MTEAQVVALAVVQVVFVVDLAQVVFVVTATAAAAVFEAIRATDDQREAMASARVATASETQVEAEAITQADSIHAREDAHSVVVAAAIRAVLAVAEMPVVQGAAVSALGHHVHASKLI